MQLGCVGHDVAAPPVSTYDRLTETQAFTVEPAETLVELRASRDHGDTTEDGTATLPVARGAVDATAAGDWLGLDDFTLMFDTVPLPTTIYPGDLALADTHVHFATPFECKAVWTDDDQAATCAATAWFTVDWKLVVGGEPRPLGSQTLGPVDLAVAIERDGGRLALDLTGRADGVIWSWADVIALGELDVTVRAYAPAF